MGVLNLTPDSFSDGGRFIDVSVAVAHALAMVEQGADLLDLGAESTRPGAAPVPAAQEIDRLMPVLERLRDCGCALSVDTRKPEVMRAAIAAGADMINDVGGFADPAARDAVAADARVACCVMHMQGDPLTMQQAPAYRDVVVEVRDRLVARAAALQDRGVSADRIVVDPGIGFGKTLEHNLSLLGRLDLLAAAGWTVMVGVSRKSMLGALTGRSVGERLPAGLAAMLAAVARGARIVRVHDVAPTRDALEVWSAIADAR
jgi:dihydropteroate synthase